MPKAWQIAWTEPAAEFWPATYVWPRDALCPTVGRDHVVCRTRTKRGTPFACRTGVLLYPEYEGVTWIRGDFLPGSEQANALLAAFALTR